MIVRAGSRSGETADLYWGCSRAPACTGRRRVEMTDALRPHAADASVQAIFEWECAREAEVPDRRPGPWGVLDAGVRLVDTAAHHIPRRDRRADEREGRRPTPRRSIDPEGKPAGRLIAGLVEHGYVVLENRRLSFARARLDYVVIGPTGLFVVERHAWSGQLEIEEGELFVDGRLRLGATDEVARATAAVEETMRHELKPLGAAVSAVLCVERASPPWFSGAVHGVIVTNGRSLPRSLRTGEAALGPETVVRVALAADRLLE